MGSGTVVSRAISEAIASLIAFSIVIMFLLGIYYTMLSSLPKVSEVPKIDIAEMGLYSIEVIDLDNNRYDLRNPGPIPISIDIGVASDDNGLKLVNIDKVCNGSRAIQPGGNTILICSKKIVAFIARMGSSLNLIGIIYPERYMPPVPIAINMTPLLKWNIIFNFTKYLEDPDTIRSSAINTSVNMMLYVNSSKTITADLYGVALAIVASAEQNRYNILIVGAGALGKPNSVNVDGYTYNLTKAGYYRYRIKIINFTGSINIGRGVYPCYINSSGTCRITFSGTADTILIYTNSSRIERDIVGIEPFYIIGDLDGNGYPEYIFATQDFSWGDSSSVNDRIITRSGSTQSSINVVDSSIKPLRIIFRDQAVNSSRYLSAIVSLRFFYWDNSQDDVSDNDNRVILRVGLYDPISRSFVYSTSLSYYELCRYRSVSPFSASYIVKDFLLYVPSEPRNKIYYVAIEIVDPYSVEVKRNDADIILGIEYVGVVLGVRR